MEVIWNIKAKSLLLLKGKNDKEKPYDYKLSDDQPSSLEDVLDNEDIIRKIVQESPSEYAAFFDQTAVSQLIDYVTKECIEPEDLKKSFKYPYNACELLCSDSSYIIEVIFQETIIHSNGSEQLIIEEDQIITNDDDDADLSPKRKPSGVSKYKTLEHLLSFLHSEYVTNTVLCGYFSKIFNKLVKCQGLFLINYLFNDGKTALTQLISHIEHDSICHCIYSLLVFNCKSELIKNKKVQLFQMIINQLIIDLNRNIVAVCGMLSNAFCNEQFVLFFLEHIDLLNSFCPVIISKQYNKETCLLKLIIQIIEVVSKYNVSAIPPAEILANNMQVYNLYEGDSSTSMTFASNDKGGLATAIKDSIQLQISTLLDIISQLCLLYIPESPNPLIIASNSNAFINTYRIIQIRLGNEKLLIIALIRSVLILFNQSSDSSKTIKKTVNCLHERKVMRLIIEIFFNFELCNSFHHYFIDIVKTVLSNVSGVFEQLIHELLAQDQGDLIGKMIDFIASRNKMTFISSQKTTSCLFASVVSLLDIICMSTNKTALRFTEDNAELELIHTEIVAKVLDVFNGFLLYDNNEIISNDESDTIEEDFKPKHHRSQSSVGTIVDQGLKRLKDYRLAQSKKESSGNYCRLNKDGHLSPAGDVSENSLDIAMVSDSLDDSMCDIIQIEHQLPKQLIALKESSNAFYDNSFWHPVIAFGSEQDENDLMNDLLNE